jgi:penicillin-binding protein 1A
MVSWIAVWLCRREWQELQPKLMTIYREHRRADEYCPPPFTQQLLISGEDHRFFQHGGIDLIAICRAIWRGTVLRRPEGASTIEMQVVRVVSGRFERTLRRKVREIALATLVARAIPKHALPGVYLRIAYYGFRMNGFQAACRHLRVRPDTLTRTQAAQLVARLKYPQPRACPPRRARQIRTRAQYLLRLQSQHNREMICTGLVHDSRYETV